MANKQHRYSSLSSDEDETNSFIHDSEKTKIQYEIGDKNLKSKFRALLPWLAHLVFLLIYTAIYLNWKRPAEIKEIFFCEPRPTQLDALSDSL